MRREKEKDRIKTKMKTKIVFRSYTTEDREPGTRWR
jgi:hypothetical protein